MKFNSTHIAIGGAAAVALVLIFWPKAAIAQSTSATQPTNATPKAKKPKHAQVTSTSAVSVGVAANPQTDSNLDYGMSAAPPAASNDATDAGPDLSYSSDNGSQYGISTYPFDGSGAAESVN